MKSILIRCIFYYSNSNKDCYISEYLAQSGMELRRNPNRAAAVSHKTAGPGHDMRSTRRIAGVSGTGRTFTDAGDGCFAGQADRDAERRKKECFVYEKITD